jgi:hypothetical protein
MDVNVESSENIKPWTIKNIAPEERNAAIEAAQRARLPLGAWMSRAIRTQIKEDLNASRAPVVVSASPPAPVAPATAAPDTTIIELDEMASLAERVSRMSGKPVPRAITRSLLRHIRSRLEGG